MIYPSRVDLMGFLATHNLILSSNVISCWSGPWSRHRLPSCGVQELVDVLVRRVCLQGRAAPPRRRRAGRAPPCRGPRAQTQLRPSAVPTCDADKWWCVLAVLNEVISDVLWERESRIWSGQFLARPQRLLLQQNGDRSGTCRESCVGQEFFVHFHGPNEAMTGS